MEKTLKTGKIGQFGAESRVTYGGVKWVVLDARPNMSLCLAEDVLKDENGEVRYMAFDTDNKNDFAASSVRAFLTCPSPSWKSWPPRVRTKKHLCRSSLT